MIEFVPGDKVVAIKNLWVDKSLIPYEREKIKEGTTGRLVQKYSGMSDYWSVELKSGRQIFLKESEIGLVL